MKMLRGPCVERYAVRVIAFMYSYCCWQFHLIVLVFIVHVFEAFVGDISSVVMKRSALNFLHESTPAVHKCHQSHLSLYLKYLTKDAFTPGQHVARQHVTSRLLPVCWAVCCWIQGYMLPRYRRNMLPATSNILPGNMLLVAGNMLLVRAPCSGVNAA